MTGFRGAIFDVDGVLVDSPHERAWRETLRELMETSWAGIRASTSYSPERFTPELYQRVVSGKPRLSGARAVLDCFQVPEAEARAASFAERKQRMVVELIEAGEFTAFPDALRFVIALRAAGLRLAAASSSKNAGSMLRRVPLPEPPGPSLRDAFDVDISGRDFARGKPHPEIFLTAAEELGLAPSECFVVEDAVSGIQAAKAGELAALGVARGDDAPLLLAASPDLLVSTLDEVALEPLAERVLASRAPLAAGD